MLDSFLLFLAQKKVQKIEKSLKNPVATQKKQLQDLLLGAQDTQFGKDHCFENIQNEKEFAQAIPLRNYEDFLPYIEKIKAQEQNVLWKGLPLYLAKTSGTTAQTKYIPISKESIHNHIQSAQNALLFYLHQTQKTAIFGGKMMFLQGSPILEKKGKLNIGRLSGIVAHHVPWYLRPKRLPSFENNTIADWSQKIEAIVAQTQKQDLRVLGGIPIWLFDYLEKLIEKTGKKNVIEIFPQLSLLVYGGVNYLPYQAKMEKLLGQKIPSIELFPASEGFFAFQNDQNEDGLLLVLDQGIFYQFIPVHKMNEKNPPRLFLEEVKIGENYALVINSNAGLWGYLIGDTVRFTSLEPPKIKITGRIQQFTSAFGEHVIAQEVENALEKAKNKWFFQVREFTIAPEVTPSKGKPRHQWWIEWEVLPNLEKIKEIAHFLDESIQRENSYYKDLREGNMLDNLEIVAVKKGGFHFLMEKLGKLGEQNKVPRLSNDRKLVEILQEKKEHLD